MFFISVILLALAIIFLIAALNSSHNENIYMLCAILLAGAFTVSISIAADEYSCTKTWNMSNTQSQYTVATGCMIKIDDKWIPARNYREFEE